MHFKSLHFHFISFHAGTMTVVEPVTPNMPSIRVEKSVWILYIAYFSLCMRETAVFPLPV